MSDLHSRTLPPFGEEPTPPASLLDAQKFLQDAFRSIEPIPARTDLDGRVRELTKPSAKLEPAGRVDVYREQFWLRHRGSLRDDFRTLDHLLGEDGFAALCERYLTRFPPRDFLLRNLSADMPAFVASEAPWASDGLLADCAKIEWGFIDAYDAADPKPFDPGSLAGASEEALMSARLVMQAPLRLVATSHPVHEFRDAVRHGQNPPRPLPRDTFLVIFRKGDLLQYWELERPAFEVVRALVQGVPLGEACGRAVEAGMPEAEVGEKLGQWFQHWTQWGWLERVEI